MKVTRLRTGYRIHLTDGEYEALEHLVALGTADVESDHDGQMAILSARGRRAWKSTFGMRGPLAITDDRRVADVRRKA